MRKAKTEGKKKGLARLRRPGQSARGFGTAPRVQAHVPCKHNFAHCAWRARVPFPTCCATVRWSNPNGIKQRVG